MYVLHLLYDFSSLRLADHRIRADLEARSQIPMTRNMFKTVRTHYRNSCIVICYYATMWYYTKAIQMSSNWLGSIGWGPLLPSTEEQDRRNGTINRHVTMGWARGNASVRQDRKKTTGKKQTSMESVNIQNATMCHTTAILEWAA